MQAPLPEGTLSAFPDKELSSVTDTEMESLCSDITEYFSEAEFIKGSCRFGAIFVGGVGG